MDTNSLPKYAQQLHPIRPPLSVLHLPLTLRRIARRSLIPSHLLFQLIFFSLSSFLTVHPQLHTAYLLVISLNIPHVPTLPSRSANLGGGAFGIRETPEQPAITAPLSFCSVRILHLPLNCEAIQFPSKSSRRSHTPTLARISRPRELEALAPATTLSHSSHRRTPPAGQLHQQVSDHSLALLY